MTTDSQGNDPDRLTRMRRVARATPPNKAGDRKRPAQWEGESAAIYCRISHVADEDQTGVDRQERLCREVADRLGLVVAPEQIFVDNNRSAWKRDRIRKGWDALLGAARRGTVQHIIAYHPDRLMRQPKDLEELLTISDDANIMLHGQANRRDLSDADDRFFLRIEVAHACRSSDDTSRRLKDAMVDRAQDGKPHTGRRRYGYTANGMAPEPSEALIVREIFARYLDGDSPRSIATDLNARNVSTLTKSKWEAWRVLNVLDSTHVAGIRIFRGQEIGQGEWEPIIDPGTFAEVKDRRTLRAAAHEVHSQQSHYYLLRGLVMCQNCTVRMNGTGGRYACIRRDRQDEAIACGRRIAADKLEEFVVEIALHKLEKLKVRDDAPKTVLSDDDKKALAAANGEISVIQDMWRNTEINASEYREMRKVVEARITKLQTRAVVRPTASVLKGITGPNAGPAWAKMVDDGALERQNAILRFLFSAVVIGPSSIVGHFDYSRIDVRENKI